MILLVPYLVLSKTFSQVKIIGRTFHYSFILRMALILRVYVQIKTEVFLRIVMASVINLMRKLKRFPFHGVV